MEVEQQGRRPSLASDRDTRPDNAGWSPRARRLIEEVHSLCASWLETPLRQCLNEAEQRLYAQAERSRNPVEQQQCLFSRQVLQQQRAAVERRYLEGIRQHFGTVGTVHDPEPQVDAPRRPLELLDTTEHEQNVALDKLVARGEARHGSALFELGYRFAVLVSLPPLEGESLPLGPQALAVAFREAASPLELPVEHHLLLLQSFDMTVVHGLATLYDTVNEHLRADGILPQLRAFPTTPRAQVERHPRSAPAENPPTPFQRPATAASTPNNAAAPRTDSIAVLDNLREMLAQHRAGQGALNYESGRAATPGELQLALDALQLHVSDVAENARRELLSAQALRDELLTQLNAGRPEGAAQMHLSDEQGDTVELVAMLFEQMDRQLQHKGNAHSLLGDLQLPLLRMAVADQGFFNQSEHPARKLLGVVADAANDWLDGPDGDVDRSLEAKINQLVDRARREPPSTGLYTSLLADIEHHLGLLNRKAQIAERRQVEAMQGRERLEQARHRAAELMTERFEKCNPRGLLRTLLERAWSDVLALTLLRHGEDSEAFLLRLRITDQLLGQLPVADNNLLQAEVESGLQQIGMHAEEAVQVAQRLLGIPATKVANTEVATTTELALKLKQRQRLGEHVAPDAPAAAPAAPTPPPSPESPERRIRQRLRQLPFGSWFEFIDSNSGTITQRKLAWYSPVSGNSLFVTRRGLRGQEMTLEQLAHEMACGRVREMPPVKENLLDRAWHALTTQLRQLTNGHVARPGASS
jgi:hypothetical protein